MKILQTFKNSFIIHLKIKYHENFKKQRSTDRQPGHGPGI